MAVFQTGDSCLVKYDSLIHEELSMGNCDQKVAGLNTLKIERANILILIFLNIIINLLPLQISLCCPAYLI